MNDYKELKYAERMTLMLRRIYESYGYSHFRMSKFEEYDLYAQNKDFLPSDGIITFTDYGGKLMALKPDVTTSIIKNSDYRDGGVTEKYYYNENVYRTKAGSHSFGELLQTGVECIGEIGAYETAEVVMMAVRSLSSVSDSYILDISHMGIVTAILSELSLGEEEKHAIIKCIGEKSVHGVMSICDENEIGDELKNVLVSLISCCGLLSECVEELGKALAGFNVNKELEELKLLARTLSACGMDKNVRLDFSVVYDRTYYNGIVFRGFINGVPERVLSGGRYDLLLRRMGKRGGGIGFAVYADALERLNAARSIPYSDVLILTRSDDDIAVLAAEVERLISEGKTVLAAKTVPERRTFGKVMKLSEGKLIEVTD